MSDLIERQAAIDFIDAGRFVNPNEPRWSDNEVINFLKSRPSAQLECEKSEWIEEDYVTKIKIRCKKCGEYARGVYRSKFCPNCGRDMWGKNNGKTT